MVWNGTIRCLEVQGKSNRIGGGYVGVVAFTRSIKSQIAARLDSGYSLDWKYHI